MDRYQTSQRQQISPSSPLHRSSSQGRAPQRRLKSIAHRPSTVHGSPRRKLVDPNRLQAPPPFSCTCAPSPWVSRPFNATTPFSSIYFFSFFVSTLHFHLNIHYSFPSALLFFLLFSPSTIAFATLHCYSCVLISTSCMCINVYVFTYHFPQSTCLCKGQLKCVLGTTSGLQCLIGDSSHIIRSKIETMTGR